MSLSTFLNNTSETAGVRDAGYCISSQSFLDVRSADKNPPHAWDSIDLISTKLTDCMVFPSKNKAR